jgi:hypothetical protein
MNTSVFSRFPVLALMLCLAVGCHDDGPRTVGSSDVTTGQIYLDAHFTSNGIDDTFITVQLLEGGPASDTQVELDGGDELWGSAVQSITSDSTSGDLFGGLEELASRHYRLHRIEGTFFEFDFLFLEFIIKGDILYSATLPHDDEVSTYYLSFLRPNGGTEAPDSMVNLPPAFTLTAPQANETFSRADPIQLNWEPSASTDEVELTIFLSCIDGGTHTISNTGMVDDGDRIIAANALNASGIAGNCSTTVEITKSRLGTLDSAIGSGRIVGHQVRRVTFTTTD